MFRGLIKYYIRKHDAIIINQREKPKSSYQSSEIIHFLTDNIQ